jgi:hypothetical protein
MQTNVLTTPAGNPIAGVMLTSFLKWVESDRHYKRTWKKIREHGREYIEVALTETPSYLPGHYYTWSIQPSVTNRFRHVKHWEMTHCREVLHNFLVKHSRGELRANRKKK